MSLVDLIAALVRRWYVCVVGLGLTVGLCVLSWGMVKPTYEAQGTAVLLPPVPVGQADNPYLYLGGLDQAMGVVTQQLTSDANKSAVLSEAPGATYTGVQDPSVSGPIVLVTADAPTAATAERVLNEALGLIPTILTKTQDQSGVAPKDRIYSTMVTTDAAPRPMSKSRTRAVIAVGALGLLLMLAGVAITERLATGHWPRKTDKGVRGVGVADEHADMTMEDVQDPAAEAVNVGRGYSSLGRAANARLTTRPRAFGDVSRISSIDSMGPRESAAPRTRGVRRPRRDYDSRP